MSEIAITEARGRLASIIDEARKEPVYLTRRNLPVAAVVDASLLKRLLEGRGGTGRHPRGRCRLGGDRATGRDADPVGGGEAGPRARAVTYDVQVLPVAVRAIRKLPPEARRRIQAVIELLSEDPRPPAARKLTADRSGGCGRGDYGVLYRIEDGILTVVVVHAGHRREVYR
ncbi:type II toxin-antitoxin system prevent-host-death family antitoxin [Microbacterium sp. NRRL B-14842]|uniref:type II toxin-antitoxin system prevent-host-death family antitoxin n=1 Tax=Microbacterium sp. NRRL B-14842 TaxID=3162881 RepID=UPI003D26C710